METEKLKEFLNRKVDEYNQPSFIKDDPVSIPHLFSKKQDIEIAAFFASIFAWGNRTTIIQKSIELMQLMDMSPYEFCMDHDSGGLKRLSGFKHRTFNTTDLLYFVEFLKNHYTRYQSLEDAFLINASEAPPLIGARLSHSRPTGSSGRAGRDDLVGAGFVGSALAGFHHYFFSLEHVPDRTRKHVATPEKNSTCKRLNMFLRWMVRKDQKGVDFGIWERISPSQLICPIDLHVARVVKRFNILQRKQVDWQAAIELTEYLRRLDPQDPVKYDFALFGLGVVERF